MILAALLEGYLDDEAKNQGINIDSGVVAETLVEGVKELMQQTAYDTVNFIVDARDSLPCWESPTGDVPSMAELKGQCR